MVAPVLEVPGIHSLLRQFEPVDHLIAQVLPYVYIYYLIVVIEPDLFGKLWILGVLVFENFGVLIVSYSGIALAWQPSQVSLVCPQQKNTVDRVLVGEQVDAGVVELKEVRKGRLLKERRERDFKDPGVYVGHPS